MQPVSVRERLVSVGVIADRWSTLSHNGQVLVIAIVASGVILLVMAAAYFAPEPADTSHKTSSAEWAVYQSQCQAIISPSAVYARRELPGRRAGLHGRQGGRRQAVDGTTPRRREPGGCDYRSRSHPARFCPVATTKTATAVMAGHRCAACSAVQWSAPNQENACHRSMSTVAPPIWPAVRVTRAPGPGRDGSATNSAVKC